LTTKQDAKIFYSKIGSKETDLMLNQDFLAERRDVRTKEKRKHSFNHLMIN